MVDKEKIRVQNQEVLLKELTYLGLYHSLGNILPYTSERTPAQYKRIRMYPMCWLGLNFIKLGLASVPPVFESEDEEAKCITEAVFKPLWNKLIRESLEALDYGWKPFEILWKSDKIYYKKKDIVKHYEGIILDSPKGLDPETIYLLTDPNTGRLSGFEQYGIQEKILCEDHKAMVFTHMLESGQYYGISALEPGYPYWFDANLNRQFHMRWLERKGVGILKGIYPPGETLINNKSVDNQDIMLDLLSSIIEGRVVSLPSKRDESGNLVWDISFLSDDDKTDPFINRAKYLDESILRSLIIPEKALTQGEIGARATVEAYQNLFLERKETLLDDIVENINERLVKPFVNYNFGSETRVNVYAGEFSDRSKEVAGRLVEKLVDKDKIKINNQWLIDKTSIPLEETTELKIKENPTIDILNKDKQNNKEESVESGTKENIEIDLKENDKRKNLSDNRWRLLNRLEQKYNLTKMEDYLNDRSQEFKDDLQKEILNQQERIISYINKNYINDEKFIKVVNEIEIRKAPIRRLFKNFMFDINTYIYNNLKEVIENRRYFSDNSSSFISFRMDVTADKYITELESAIKYQLSSDMSSKLSKVQIIDRLKNSINNIASEYRLKNIINTETGFVLGRTFEDYLKDNDKAIKKGLLNKNKKVERVKYSAIMDSDVCPICKELDGTVVPVESPIRYKYDPPIHYHCRCVWLPVTLEDIDDPDIIETELTQGEKGSITLDEMIVKIGNKSKYKTF
jgi:SPP1 gp7 family putative phage head morphogenesis protein